MTRASAGTASSLEHLRISPGLPLTDAPTATRERASRAMTPGLDHLAKPWACRRCGMVRRLNTSETCATCAAKEAAA